MSVFAIVMAVLVICSMALQFVPYFRYDGGSVSLAGYMAFPLENKDATAYLVSQNEGFVTNDIVAEFFTPLIGGIILLILLYRYRENMIVMGLSGAWGLSGMLIFALNSSLRLGGGARIANIAVFTAAAAVSAAYLIARIQSRRHSDRLAENHKGKEELAAQHS
jgi:hypothetical protein